MVQQEYRICTNSRPYTPKGGKASAGKDERNRDKCGDKGYGHIQRDPTRIESELRKGKEIRVRARVRREGEQGQQLGPVENQDHQ